MNSGVGANMKKFAQTAAGFCSAALAVVAVVCVAGRLPAIASQNAAVAAAGFILPGGAVKVIQDGYLEEDEEDDSISSAPQGTSSSAQSTAPASSVVPQSSGSSAVISSPPSSGGKSSIKITEVSIANSGTQYQNIWVKNTNKNHGIDIASELSKRPAVKIIKNSSTPQVLIYHTHTTEAYVPEVPRNRDTTKNVVAVGEQIANQLKAAGINVVHDITEHDYPAYNGAYDRSKVTIQKNLKKYPGIQVTLDIHRDAMTLADNSRCKPTAVVNGKKAAQVMIISGCDDDGTYNFPNWEYNLRLAVRLQKSMSDLYGGLARPLNFLPRKYNENLTKGSLLVEFGTEANTIEEAKYSGELFGKSLAAVLSQLT